MSRHRLIIFEGCDGSGKSTLIEKLTSVVPNNYLVNHNGVYESREIAFATYNAQLNTHSDSQLLLDRSYISELIYGSIIRGEDNSKIKKEVSKLEDRIKLYFKPLIVFCNPPLETVLNVWEGRTVEEYVKRKEKITQIYNEYQLIDKYTSLPIVEFDYTNVESSYLALIRELIK